MNLHQLEYIIAVDQLKNFNKAAGACLVTQATLSAMVKKLEEELEVIIFDRKTKPVITTDYGKQIIAEARKAIYHANRLKEISCTLNNKVEGKVKIGIISNVANSLLPHILKELLDNYPLLELDFIECSEEQAVRKLKSGGIDMAILTTPGNIDDLEEITLYSEALLIYGNLDEKKNYVFPKNMKNFNFWVLEEGNCSQDQSVEVCRLEKNSTLYKNLKFEAHSFETLMNLADKFGGLTLVPELYYKSLSTERKNKVRSFQTPVPVREIKLLYYRPYAKLGYIDTLAKDITNIVNSKLEFDIFTCKKNDFFKVRI
ncbi:LysR substrate-binding domain-containing protein [Chondrinema litorale]|uniref:LysR substrate-binding domain-containing protein n=1 Tax=Chondrinema litorale TaxID=2994555 RepID=UPI002543CF73|nr:LysR substrate-binding domain-containing protein [Chondrinema litorale]UZR97635.1 LysR substrate-binding domain-containing protein [Chondrinema litorale]